MHSPIARKPAANLTIAEARSMPAYTNPAMEAQRLEIVLTPATDAEAMEALQFLFKILPMENAGNTLEEKQEIAGVLMAAYAYALRGLPRWAIMEARANFIAGRVKDQSKEFAPKPPSLGHEASRLVDELRMKLGRAMKQADEQRQIEPDVVRRPTSASVSEQAAKRIAELRALADEDRMMRAGGRRYAPTWEDPNPITAEALEAAGIPDAPSRGPASAAASSFRPLRRDVSPMMEDLKRRKAAGATGEMGERA